MAEIRKHDPAAGSAIAQALKAAMGEPVRPRQPGDRPQAPKSEPEATSTTAWLSVKVNPEPEADEEPEPGQDN